MIFLPNYKPISNLPLLLEWVAANKLQNYLATNSLFKSSSLVYVLRNALRQPLQNH